MRRVMGCGGSPFLALSPQERASAMQAFMLDTVLAAVAPGGSQEAHAGALARAGREQTRSTGAAVVRQLNARADGLAAAVAVLAPLAPDGRRSPAELRTASSAASLQAKRRREAAAAKGSQEAEAKRAAAKARPRKRPREMGLGSMSREEVLAEWEKQQAASDCSQNEAAGKTRVAATVRGGEVAEG